MAYTTVDDPSAFFQAITWTGNGSDGRALTNDGNSDLKPDWVWLKNYDLGYNHFLTDSSRGNTKVILSDSTTAEGTYTNMVESFDTDGFTIGYDGSQVPNYNGNKHVAWQWKANGGTTSSNSDGNITSTVQANTDAGFSIVTWTGNEQSAASVGHGLGVTPEMVLFKRRNATYYWVVYLGALGQTGGNNMFAYLNVNNAAEQGAGITFTSSLLNPGSGATTNSGDMIAYCFNSVQGYSKFGKYTGNSHSGGDGPFIHTGFAPAYVMIKRTDAANDWIIHTYKFGTLNAAGSLKGNEGNPNTSAFRANETSVVNEWGNIDMLSNGFKVRSGGGASENASGTYIYMAFAEHPFVTSTGIPTTAR